VGDVDFEVSVLTATAATTLVRQMTTEGWERAHTALGAWWRRARPGPEGRAVEAQLALSRATALDARESGDPSAEQELVDEWKLRLGTVLAERPQFADELRQLLAQWQCAPPAAVADRWAADPAGEPGRVELHMHASGHGRLNAAGHELHITGSE
jgi:hypothetical protein